MSEDTWPHQPDAQLLEGLEGTGKGAEGTHSLTLEVTLLVLLLSLAVEGSGLVNKQTLCSSNLF